MRLVNDHNLVLEVDAERFACALLEEEVVGKGDELKCMSDSCNFLQ